MNYNEPDKPLFILIEFGKTISETVKATRLRPEYIQEYGEWGLWLYSCSWRIEHKELILASTKSETKEEMVQAVSEFNGRTIEAVDIVYPFWDTVFTFSDDYVVKTFSTSMERDHWTLRTPSGKYLVAGPGTSWDYCL